MKKIYLFVLLLAFALVSQNFVLAADQVIIDLPQSDIQTSSGPRLETGSVSPSYGPPGEYTFHTFFSDPENRKPEYVKIYIADVSAAVLIEETEPYLMRRNPANTVTQWGIEYTYTHNLTQEGLYNFYFEAKVGSKIIHNPYYGGDDCKPGLCSECCGTWGGPKVLSEELIDDHKIYLFDKNLGEPVWSYEVGKNWVTSVAFSADNKKLAAADNQGNLYLFNVGSNSPVWIYGIESNAEKDNGIKIGASSGKGLVAFSGNDYIAASLEGQVFLFKTDSNKPIWKYDIGMTLEGLVISADGKYIAAGGHDTKVYLWETDSSIPKWEYKVESKGGILGLEGSVIRAMAMTQDGKYFTAGTSCPDRSVYVFTPEKSEPFYKVKAGANFPVEAIGISDDGQYVVAVGGGSYEDLYSALLFKAGQEEPLWKFDYSKNPSISAAISPNGQSVALGYIIDGVYMVQRDSKNPLWQLKNSGYVGDMVFSRDGKMLALGTGTYHVILLSADGSQILQDWKVENKVESVAMSPNGQYVAAGTSLNRYLVIGGGKDNISGAGAGQLKDLKPELVKISDISSKLQPTEKMQPIEKEAESSQEIPKFYFWIGFLLGIGLLVFGLIILIIKRKIWMIVIVLAGIGLVGISCYYLFFS